VHIPIADNWDLSTKELLIVAGSKASISKTALPEELVFAISQ
jgi:hypothetical protein